MTTWMLGRILWAAAILPPLVLLLDIYRRDRVEKEPPKLLAALFFGGAVSVLPAALLERAGFALAGRILPAASVPHAALCCFAAVGLVEEGGKFLVLRLGSWRSPAFNYRFDGIVYAVFVSMGFALVENLLYVAGDGTLATALLRSVTAIPGHASFAVILLRDGKALRRRRRTLPGAAPRGGMSGFGPAEPPAGLLDPGAAPWLL